MALSYHIDKSLGVIRVSRTGRPTFDEFRSFMEGLLADSAFQTGWPILEDRREDLGVPSRSEVEVMAAWIRANAARLGQMRWAVVLPGSALAAFGMVRVGEFLTERSGVTLRAFTSVEAATAWALGGASAE